jgi:hypothetical protein
LKRWSRLNGVDGAPDPNEQVLIYQSMLGAWPIDAGRLKNYVVKALREAKIHTSWIDIDEAYERRVLAFVDRILDPAQSGEFLEDFTKLQKKVAFHGAISSLAQTVLRMTAPGIPDFYQGTELWDFSLADPDNRRPVDFQARAKVLEGVPPRPSRPVSARRLHSPAGQRRPRRQRHRVCAPSPGRMGHHRGPAPDHHAHPPRTLADRPFGVAGYRGGIRHRRTGPVAERPDRRSSRCTAGRIACPRNVPCRRPLRLHPATLIEAFAVASICTTP